MWTIDASWAEKKNKAGRISSDEKTKIYEDDEDVDHKIGEKINYWALETDVT